MSVENKHAMDCKRKHDQSTQYNASSLLKFVGVMLPRNVKGQAVWLLGKWALGRQGLPDPLPEPFHPYHHCLPIPVLLSSLLHRSTQTHRWGDHVGTPRGKVTQHAKPGQGHPTATTYAPGRQSLPSSNVDSSNRIVCLKYRGSTSQVQVWPSAASSLFVEVISP